MKTVILKTSKFARKIAKEKDTDQKELLDFSKTLVEESVERCNIMINREDIR